MSTEIDRAVIGLGERGEVVVIHYSNRYIVRMGAFTVIETANRKDAEAMGKALCR